MRFRTKPQGPGHQLVTGPWAVALSLALSAALPACSGASGSPGTRPSPKAATGTMVTGPRAFLYLVSPAGGVPHPLLSPGDSARLQSESDPAWSPDGRQLAFAAGCASCSARLYVVSSSGRNLREIPTGPGAVSSPSWSPDGRAIVFARENGEDQLLYSVNLRTGRLRLVNGEPTGSDNTDSTPAWSPSGRWIAFTREVHHEKVNLYLVPAAGGSLRALTRRRQFEQVRPRWSPDGRKILYMQAEPPDFTWDLLILDVRTGKASRLTRSPHNEFDPAWSPSGKEVVFAGDAASPAGFRSLYIIMADGLGLDRLTASSQDDSMPSWSPNGKTIVFVRRPTMRD